MMRHSQQRDSRGRGYRRLPADGSCPVLVASVVAAFGLTPADLRRPSRGTPRAAFARQVAMYCAHVWLGLSMTEVGRLFERDRTTVAHACRVVEEAREDPRVDRVVDAVESALANWRESQGHLVGEAA
jgi:chromosomal replication initiation ATPase DnaA